MTLSFGDQLSNALHEIKQYAGKKIGALQDEIGYTFDPHLTGDTIESWRYRKRPPTTVHLERLAESLVAYGSPRHDRAWLVAFLQSADHPYPDAVADRLFPDTAQNQPVPAPPQIDFAPPPLRSYRAPNAVGFVGRAAETARYRAQLAAEGVAVVAGMAGVGKTSLAASLAGETETPDAVFWHSFYDGDLTSLIRRLAGFLAGHGRPELWEAYEAARTTGTQPPDVASSFDTLRAHLAGLEVLLCLDDLQFVDEEPPLQTFLQRVATSEEIPARLLITSRRVPSFLRAALAVGSMDGPVEELEGLDEADTRALLDGRDVDLAEGLTRRLHEVTGGNGAFLTLAAVVLRRTRDAAPLIEELASVDDVERFLMEEVNDRLSASEQRVMEAVAVLGGYPGTRDAVEAMLNQRDVRRPLRDLRDQYLLTVQQTEGGVEYGQHQILQGFYYEQPPRATRRRYHQRAGEFYEHEEIDPFKATLHYVRGALAARAVAVASEALWEIVNAGQARSLWSLLATLDADKLDHEPRLSLLLVSGQLGTFLGEYDVARTSLDAANALLDDQSDDPTTRTARARVCLAVAKLLERSAPPESLDWAERGLENAPYENKELLAALKIQAGTVSLYMGNLGGAMETLHDGLDDLGEEGPVSLRIDGLMYLGWTGFLAGQLGEARQYTSDALALSKQQRSHFHTARVYINLGPIKYVSGDWPGAVADLEEGLSIARRLGSRDATTAFQVNLGGCYTTMGEDEQAFHHLTQALQLAEEDSSHLEITARIRLAQLHNNRNQPDTALEILAVAEEKAEEKNDQISLHTVYGRKGEALYIKRDYAQAIKFVEQAIRGLRILGEYLLVGDFWRLRGKIAIKIDEVELAEQAFSTSQNLLKGRDNYREALTLLDWAQLSMSNRQINTASTQLQKAKAVFTELGAHHKTDYATRLEKSLSRGV